MDKTTAFKTAIELTSALLGSVTLQYIPVESQAEDVGNFVEALIARLEKIDID